MLGLLLNIVALFLIITIDSRSNAFSNQNQKQFFVHFIERFYDDMHNFLYVVSNTPGKLTIEMLGRTSNSNSSNFIEEISMQAQETRIIKLPIHPKNDWPLKTTGKDMSGILVTSTADVDVMAVSKTSDGTPQVSYKVLPIEALSTEYIIPAAWNNSVLTIGGLVDDTLVDIYLNTSCDLYIGGIVFNRSNVLHTHLKLFEVFYLVGNSSRNQYCDFGGTKIVANHPVSVMSGSLCLKGETDLSCGPTIQPVIPLTLWGKRFFIADLYDTVSYRVRIVAAANGTNVTVFSHSRTTESLPTKLLLHEANVVDVSVPDGEALTITSDENISVTQYSMEYSPFGIAIPSVEHFNHMYTINPMSDKANVASYVTVAIASSANGSLKVDGKSPHVSLWVVPMNSGYSVITLPITGKTHRLEASGPFYAVVYNYGLGGSIGFWAGYHFENPPSVDLVITRPSLSHTTVSPVDTSTPPSFSTSTTSDWTSANSPCADKEGIDCHLLQTSLNICHDIVTSTEYCRKYCNRC